MKFHEEVQLIELLRRQRRDSTWEYLNLFMLDRARADFWANHIIALDHTILIGQFKLLLRVIAFAHEWEATGLSREDLGVVSDEWPRISPDTKIQQVHHHEWRYEVHQPLSIWDFSVENPPPATLMNERHTCYLRKYTKPPYNRTWGIGYAPEIDTIFWM